MSTKGPVALGNMELFSDTLEELGSRPQDLKKTLRDRDPAHVQEVFGHSPEFTTAWAATLAAIDQAYSDGHLPNEQTKTVLYAYLYKFLGSSYQRAESRQLEEHLKRLTKDHEHEFER